MKPPSKPPSIFPCVDKFVAEQKLPDTAAERQRTYRKRMRELGFYPANYLLTADERLAVDAFLTDKVGFLEMSDIVETCMAKIPFILHPQYEDYVKTDSETRIIAKELIS